MSRGRQRGRTLPESTTWYRSLFENALEGIFRSTAGRTLCRSQPSTAEEALQESEARYRNLFENANDMIATSSLDGIITSVNRGLEVALGWSREELIGQHYRKLATPAALALADERTQQALAGEVLPSIFAAETIRKDGRVVPVEVRSRFIRDAAGQPIGVQGIFQDLTDRQQMETALKASEAKYRTIFAASPDFLYLTDSAGKLLDANPALLDWQGMSLAELQQRHFLDFLAGDNREEVVQAFAALQQGRTVRGLEVRARNVQGETREFEVNAMPLPDPEGGTVILSVARDITARKQAEERLHLLSRQLLETQESERRHLARELHDEIGQRLTALKINLQALQPIPKRAVPYQQESVRIVDSIVQQIRSLSLDLRPSQLDNLSAWWTPSSGMWIGKRSGRVSSCTLPQTRCSHVPAQCLRPLVFVSCKRR